MARLRKTWNDCRPSSSFSSRPTTTHSARPCIHDHRIGTMRLNGTLGSFPRFTSHRKVTSSWTSTKSAATRDFLNLLWARSVTAHDPSKSRAVTDRPYSSPWNDPGSHHTIMRSSCRMRDCPDRANHRQHHGEQAQQLKSGAHGNLIRRVTDDNHREQEEGDCRQPGHESAYHGS